MTNKLNKIFYSGRSSGKSISTALKLNSDHEVDSMTAAFEALAPSVECPHCHKTLLVMHGAGVNTCAECDQDCWVVFHMRNGKFVEAAALPLKRQLWNRKADYSKLDMSKFAYFKKCCNCGEEMLTIDPCIDNLACCENCRAILGDW